MNRVDSMLLREVKENKNHRFTSYSDYNRFIAASARFKESKG